MKSMLLFSGMFIASNLRNGPKPISSDFVAQGENQNIQNKQREKINVIQESWFSKHNKMLDRSQLQKMIKAYQLSFYFLP